MSEIQAKCPHCSTSFSISSEQLKVADGHVRCGVCMKVFKADTGSSIATEFEDESGIEAWIKRNQKTAPTENSISSMQSGPVTAPENLTLESLQFDDDISDDFLDVKPAAAPGSPGFSLLLDDEEDKKAAEKPVPAYAAKLADDKAESDSLSIRIGTKVSPVKKRPTPKPAPEKNPIDDLQIDIDDDPFNFSGGEEEVIVSATLGSAYIEEELEIVETPVNVKILWTSLTAVFSILLITQVLVKEFDRLALTPVYRSLYTPFCAIGLCQLPSLNDVSKIKGSNLIVRPHPRQSGALSVDAIINNQALFDQKFPDLYLRFSNIQGGVIASRRFKPEEYLGGELKSLSIMPSQTPLHISIEILDPGPDAISYHLDFLPSS